MKTADELILSVELWADQRNLLTPDKRPHQMLKVIEEIGETAAALARGNRRELKDGIGDSFVTLIILAAQSGFTATECLDAAYEEIKNRKGTTVNGVFIKE